MSHPQFCEIVQRAARLGTYLARHGQVHYSILWNDEVEPRWVPAVGIRTTGQINHTLLNKLSEEISRNISSRVNIRRRGGLKKGKRTAVQAKKPPQDDTPAPRKT